jgi:hypothetical protein
MKTAPGTAIENNFVGHDFVECIRAHPQSFVAEASGSW